jgi:PPOX class probable F420-dependent enzyme
VSYDKMSPAEWLAFLQDPVRPALLGTTRADGRPHVMPIWYAVDVEGDDVTVVWNTGADTVKGRNIRRDGRVSLCVQDDRPPFSFVTLSGTARWSDDLPDVREWAGRIGARYMGEDRADEYGTRNGVPGELVVRLTPSSVVAYKDVAD